MKKENRIKKATEIENVLKNRKFRSSKYFSVYVFNNKETNKYRYAISAGKKIGNAVARNKVKRQVRSLVDSISSLDQCLDVFIIIRPIVLNTDYQILGSDLTYLFKKLNIKLRGEI